MTRRRPAVGTYQLWEDLTTVLFYGRIARDRLENDPETRQIAQALLTSMRSDSMISMLLEAPPER